MPAPAAPSAQPVASLDPFAQLQGFVPAVPSAVQPTTTTPSQAAGDLLGFHLAPPAPAPAPTAAAPYGMVPAVSQPAQPSMQAPAGQQQASKSSAPLDDFFSSLTVSGGQVKLGGGAGGAMPSGMSSQAPQPAMAPFSMGMQPMQPTQAMQAAPAGFDLLGGMGTSGPMGARPQALGMGVAATGAPSWQMPGGAGVGMAPGMGMPPGAGAPAVGMSYGGNMQMPNNGMGAMGGMAPAGAPWLGQQQQQQPVMGGMGAMTAPQPGQHGGWGGAAAMSMGTGAIGGQAGKPATSQHDAAFDFVKDALFK